LASLSDGMSLDLATFLGNRHQQIVSKRLTVFQKTCYHKKEKIDGVVWVRLTLPPDNPTQALTRLEGHPLVSVY
jgi:ubiquinone biosynthesis protein COQ9